MSAKRPSSAETQPAAPQPLDAAGRVAVDLSCVACGYNLRTLLAEGRCPECTQPVASAIDKYRGYPEWLSESAENLVLLARIALAILVLGGLGSILLFLPLLSFLGVLLLIFTYAAILALGLGGIITALTAPPHPQRRRLFGRWTVGLCTATITVCFLLVFVGGGGVRWLLGISAAAGLLALAALPAALLWSVADLMVHCHQVDLKRRGRILAGLVLLLDVLAATILAVAFTAWLPSAMTFGGPGFAIEPLLIYPAIFGALFLLVVTVIYLHVCANALSAYVRVLRHQMTAGGIV